MSNSTLGNASLSCFITFNNENFHERANEPSISRMMHIDDHMVIRSDESRWYYKLTAVYPTYTDQYSKTFSIHESDYIDIIINCCGDKKNIHFAIGSMIKPDILKKIIDGAKNSQDNIYVYNHKMFLQNCVDSHFVLNCDIKFVRYQKSTMIELVSLEIDKALADEWFNDVSKGIFKHRGAFKPIGL